MQHARGGGDMKAIEGMAGEKLEEANEANGMTKKWSFSNNGK